jgi:hypothetical protein
VARRLGGVEVGRGDRHPQTDDDARHTNQAEGPASRVEHHDSGSGDEPDYEHREDDRRRLRPDDPVDE